MEERTQMNISSIRANSKAPKTCEMCKQTFPLNEHHMGLVFKDKFFICQDCQMHTSDQEIMEWTQNVMRHPEVGMPIPLWLIHEQNRDKQLLIRPK
jgi:hypothetical protein